MCRFDPSCSHYAIEAFEHRPFFVAAAMTASRLLRCNPLVRRMTSDPVQRSRRAPRPGTVRSLCSFLFLVGLVMSFGVIGTAVADAPTGGCEQVQVNGRSAVSITKSNPLKVREHETVSATGRTPPGLSGQNRTTVEVILIDGIGGITSKEHSGDGDSWSSSTVEVDDYLKAGLGTYKVEVVNSGPGWRCTVVGYVQLDEGNPLTKPIGLAGAGLTVVGAAGALVASRVRPSARWAEAQMAKAKPRDTLETVPEDVVEATGAPKPPARAAEDMHLEFVSLGFPFCLFGMALAMLLVPLGAMPLFGAGGGGGAVRIRRRPSGPVVWRQRVWRRGRPVPGFVSGLLVGLGGTVLLWQYNVWLLSIVTLIVVPLVVAVAVATYAWVGKPFEMVAVRPPGPSASPRDTAPPAPPGGVAPSAPPRPPSMQPPAAGDEPPPPAI